MSGAVTFSSVNSALPLALDSGLQIKISHAAPDLEFRVLRSWRVRLVLAVSGIEFSLASLI